MFLVSLSNLKLNILTSSSFCALRSLSFFNSCSTFSNLLCNLAISFFKNSISVISSSFFSLSFFVSDFFFGSVLFLHWSHSPGRQFVQRGPSFLHGQVCLV